MSADETQLRVFEPRIARSDDQIAAAAPACFAEAP